MMADLHYAGKVELFKGEEETDFDSYGIKIKVSLEQRSWCSIITELGTSGIFEIFQ